MIIQIFANILIFSKVSAAIILLFIITIGTQAQTVEEIKADNKTYIYGQSTGITMLEADNAALALLISQISTSVEGSFSMQSEWGAGTEMKEKIKMVINTYSAITLNKTERIIISNEPDAEILRYIKRADVHEIFEQRKVKITDFISSAQKAEKKLQIADALRCYYWALILLQSHTPTAIRWR